MTEKWYMVEMPLLPMVRMASDCFSRYLDAAKLLYKRVCLSVSKSVSKSVTLFQRAAPWQPHRILGILVYLAGYNGLY